MENQNQTLDVGFEKERESALKTVKKVGDLSGKDQNVVELVIQNSESTNDLRRFMSAYEAQAKQDLELGYKKELEKSGVVEKDEMDFWLDGIRSTRELQDVYKMFEDLPKFIEPLKDFAQKVSELPGVVKWAIKRSMKNNRSNINYNRETDLQMILDRHKKAKKMPRAVQVEFLKNYKELEDNMDEDDFLKGLEKRNAEYDKLYETKLLKAKKHFGGDTLKEFMEWFAGKKGDPKSGLKNFKTKKRMLSLLESKMIPERIKLSEKFEELSEGLPKKEQKKRSKEFNSLGKTEKEAYIKAMEQEMQKDSPYLTRYTRSIIFGNHNGFELCTPAERKAMIKDFSSRTWAEQDAYLQTEFANEIKTRKRLIDSFTELGGNSESRREEFKKGDFATRQLILVEEKLNIDGGTLADKYDLSEEAIEQTPEEVTQKFENPQLKALLESNLEKVLESDEAEEAIMLHTISMVMLLRERSAPVYEEAPKPVATTSEQTPIEELGAPIIPTEYSEDVAPYPGGFITQETMEEITGQQEDILDSENNEGEIIRRTQEAQTGEDSIYIDIDNQQRSMGSMDATKKSNIKKMGRDSRMLEDITAGYASNRGQQGIVLTQNSDRFSMDNNAGNQATMDQLLTQSTSQRALEETGKQLGLRLTDTKVAAGLTGMLDKMVQSKLPKLRRKVFGYA